MAVEDGSCDQIIADLSHTDKAQSVCVEVNECQDKIERDLKDNEKSQTVVIRIEPTAEAAAAANEIRQNTDSLNSNNSCEKHENPSLSMTESENTSESISSSEEGDGDGVSNPAFVEDEEETEDISKKKKGHQRKPSCSPNKDIEVCKSISVAVAIQSGNQYLKCDIYCRAYQVGVVRKLTLAATHLF